MKNRRGGGRPRAPIRLKDVGLEVRRRLFCDGWMKRRELHGVRACGIMIWMDGDGLDRR